MAFILFERMIHMVIEIAVNVQGLIYTCLFGIYFLLCYFIILATRLEQLFKQGSTWQIRLTQAIIAFILAYLLAKETLSLINSMQF